MARRLLLKRPKCAARVVAVLSQGTQSYGTPDGDSCLGKPSQQQRLLQRPSAVGRAGRGPSASVGILGGGGEGRRRDGTSAQVAASKAERRCRTTEASERSGRGRLLALALLGKVVDTIVTSGKEATEAARYDDANSLLDRRRMRRRQPLHLQRTTRLVRARAGGVARRWPRGRRRVRVEAHDISAAAATDAAAAAASAIRCLAVLANVLQRLERATHRACAALGVLVEHLQRHDSADGRQALWPHLAQPPQQHPLPEAQI